jgi:superfamily I DNA/RNA helicase
LLPSELADVDGNAEPRRGAISAFDGPEPTVRICASADEEVSAITEWLKSLAADGNKPHDLAVIVRSDEQFARARAAVNQAGMNDVVLVDEVDAQKDRVSVLTMHTAKGLEFSAVAVMACDDEVIPLQQRIASVADDSDLEDVYNTERHLLYVACTRARDHLMVSGVSPASEFLDDLTLKDS